MRLICPQCNALYDVSAEMIPPEGREVECSACGHVWHQPANLREMRGLASDLRAPAARPAAPAVDLGAAPALRRPLPEDVLSILRDETARELSARRGVRLEDPLPRPPADSPAEVPAAVPAAPPVAVKPTPVRPTPPVPQPAAPKPAEPARTVVTPPAAADWPATTVTAPDDSLPRIVTRRQPAIPVPARELHPTPVLAAAQPLVEDVPAPTVTAPPVAARPAPQNSTVPPVRNPVLNPALPPLPRRRIVKTLPDAERLAATLQTQAPPSPDLPTAAPVAARAAAPDGYRAGFSRALSVAAAVLAAYVAGAAWVGTGAAPAPVVSVVAGIDAARAGFQDVARSLVGRNEKAE